MRKVKLVKWWIDSIDSINEYKFGDTENMQYEKWQKGNAIRRKCLIVLIALGVFLLIARYI